MDHAIAEEPMMARHIGSVDWVRAVAQQSALELLGDLAGHRQVIGGEFFANGPEIAGEIRRSVVEGHATFITVGSTM